MIVSTESKPQHRQDDVLVTRGSLAEISGRVLAFKRLVHILKDKQEDGNKLTPDDLMIFKDQVSRLIEDDIATLMGVIDTLVEEGEEMLTLLHEVAAAEKDDFDKIQIKCLEFLSHITFES